MSTRPKVFVAGATGYVGARLVPRLIEAGYHVRAGGRSMAKLRTRPWATGPHVELVVADVRDPAALDEAMAGCHAAYYLVHSMGPGHGEDFAKLDREAARTFRDAAARAGIRRIVYLGGLGEDSPELSEHLRSRHEVGEILADGPVATTRLRAAVILGSGSSSFEILRALTERLPVMITPRWLRTPIQPIAIRNVLAYLVGVLDKPEAAGQVYDIGGPDVLTYEKLMRTYAEEAALKRRLILQVPVLTPHLSALWIRLVTPAPMSLALPLAEGLRNAVVCKDDRIRDLVPQDLLSAREAIRRAIDVTQHEVLESHWTDSGEIPPASWRLAGDPSWGSGKPLQHERQVRVDAPPEAVWDRILRIGGDVGYYWGDPLWRARGAIDTVAGGVGLRRGRAYPQRLRPGDVVDFWRVVDVEPGRSVRLAAEMRVPGRALLEFDVRPDGEGSRFTQRALFLPRGLTGILYWYALEPIHRILFGGMARSIARAAEGRPGLAAGRSALALVAFLALAYAASAIGGFATQSSVDTWYAALTKPDWTPPGQVIGIVWAFLYATIGLAGWLVWRRVGLRHAAMVPFAIQLALNAMWSVLFFGLQAPGLALGGIALLWLSIVWTIASFGRVAPAAAWLLVPYLAWVTFAGTLNATLWWLNA